MKTSVSLISLTLLAFAGSAVAFALGVDTTQNDAFYGELSFIEVAFGAGLDTVVIFFIGLMGLTIARGHLKN